MTRDELERVIWQHWPTRGPEAGDAVDAILAAADAYKSGHVTETPTEASLHAVRCAMLDGRTLHYLPLDPDNGDEFACHPTGNATATTCLSDVTCGRCKRTDAYRDDMAALGVSA